jgi:hypothetical protein
MTALAHLLERRLMPTLFHPVIVFRVIFVHKVLCVMAIANNGLILITFEPTVFRAVPVIVLIRLNFIDNDLVGVVRIIAAVH